MRVCTAAFQEGFSRYQKESKCLQYEKVSVARSISQPWKATARLSPTTYSASYLELLRNTSESRPDAGAHLALADSATSPSYPCG